MRTRTLPEFKPNTIRFLVATDISARGLNISELSHVVNFDLPKVAEDYIHRTGSVGVTISLVNTDAITLQIANCEIET